MRILKFIRQGVLLGVAPLLVIAGAALYLSDTRFIYTDNAYIKTDIAAISAEIDGRVDRVYVRSNQLIAKGDPLFSVDRRSFEIELAEAEAKLITSYQEIEAIRASYQQGREELVQAEERVRYLTLAYDRQSQLKADGFAASKTYEQAQHDLKTAQQTVRIIRQHNSAVLANLGGKVDLKTELHPIYLIAKARRDQAVLYLEHTLVVAPVSGTASNVTLVTGEYIEAGDAVMALVDVEHLWIEANLKEVKLTHLEIGQKVEVVVDAYPDVTWPAVVESISAATGSQFSILPPQNATGNWVKIVQRMPVRLTFDPATDISRLRAGMSVSVAIDTGRESTYDLLIKEVRASVPNSLPSSVPITQ